jgi:Holliday junction resolvase RusA-like endonuclease
MSTPSKACDPLKVPHPSGEFSFSIEIRPVSSQASRTKKDAVTQAIRDITKPYKFLISGDVSVEIVWLINEDERYESDEAADIDNILKPILDALSGPDGILINDCQVQHVSSHWISRYGDDELVEITIKFDPDAFFEKDHIMFVEFRKSLFMPMHDNMSSEIIKMMLDTFEMQLAAKEKLLAQGKTYYQAKMVTSIQRIFHKTRLEGFKLTTATELRASL